MNAIELKRDVAGEIERKEWTCPSCEASRRADVEIVRGPRADGFLRLSSGELAVVIVCRACSNEDVRYYA